MVLSKDDSTVRYVQNLRTSHLQPYSSSVPYFSSIFEAYRTRTIIKKAYRTNVPYLYHHKKSVPYQRTVSLRKNWGVTYRTAILGVKYKNMKV